VRRLKGGFKEGDRLFLLLGIDAFREIATWHQACALFHECEFIVASRPGYSLADVAHSLPAGLRPAESVAQQFEKQPAKGDLVLPQVTVHLLASLAYDISATRIRQAVASGRPLTRYVDPSVAEYIKKMGLYRPAARRRGAEREQEASKAAAKGRSRLQSRTRRATLDTRHL
jgi:nicotinate-nucleotide adenylyltransferase